MTTRRASTKPHIYTDHGMLCTVQLSVWGKDTQGRELNTRAMRWTKRRNRVTQLKAQLAEAIKAAR